MRSRAVPEGVGLALSLAILAATLGAAVSRGRYPYEAAAAALGALLLVVVGAIGLSRAGDALDSLAPTVGFLAALLLIAEGCRREGLFEAIGALMARRACWRWLSWSRRWSRRCSALTPPPCCSRRSSS
jgi:arsenical pump membrane protein